ncbi:hypothetical protein O9X98_14590 [Agrobacterium salinitolerans]|nr:hypothetical protein [Agrobacterium salinitolerans]
MFRRKSWLGEQKKITKSKAAKKVAFLHEIWQSRGASVDDGHLDEVVSILLSITEEGLVREILDAWGNRTISF